MLNHSLIFLALLSFSIAAQAAAIPMDAGQAPSGAIQHADTHQDVTLAQGGNPDKDVANAQLMTCPANTQCNDKDEALTAKSPAIQGWFVVEDSSSALQPLGVLLLIIGLIVFFLSRKSASTK